MIKSPVKPDKLSPDKLSWVTINLYIYMALCILLLLGALAGGALTSVILGATGTTDEESLIGIILGVVFGIGGIIVGAIGTVLHFLAARGLQQGKRWGWVLSLILTIFNLITCLGSLIFALPAVLGLIGLFDRDVQDYTQG
ncbi:hypothetical protein [Deinococcus roseus]|uniref:DUF4064 domain-containing protein n=1 Tax=Deinococcus roseus TaxID=392414 RepID=A0ABQ2CVU8_9DEIO|nr:hypothetical protein [Deinococcus roseus]GGJ25906.1 hypothetical protein GCM10008938_10040 [Deinococcus roseus]